MPSPGALGLLWRGVCSHAGPPGLPAASQRRRALQLRLAGRLAAGGHPGQGRQATIHEASLQHPAPGRFQPTTARLQPPASACGPTAASHFRQQQACRAARLRSGAHPEDRSRRGPERREESPLTRHEHALRETPAAAPPRAGTRHLLRGAQRACQSESKPTARRSKIHRPAGFRHTGPIAMSAASIAPASIAPASSATASIAPASSAPASIATSPASFWTRKHLFFFLKPR